jgi:proliferating cell nuclear antigen PCNA
MDSSSSSSAVVNSKLSNSIVYAQTEHCSEFATLMAVLSGVLHEIKVEFIQDKIGSDGQKIYGGIRIFELDSHMTLLIYVKLSSEQFVDYYVKYPVYSVGLNLDRLSEFMKSVEKDSILNISVATEDEQNITFHTTNEANKSSYIFQLKLMDLDTEEKALPEHANFELLVTFETSEFHKMIRELSRFSEFFELTCTSKTLTFKCQGDNNSYIKKFENSEKCIRITSINNSENDKNNIVHAIYELKHLIAFGKCVGLCHEMQLFLRNDYPLFVRYTVANLGKMLIGLSPVDEKTIKSGADEPKYYNDKKINMKSKP